MEFETTAGRIWRRLTPADRAQAAAAFWSGPGEELGGGLAAIIKARGASSAASAASAAIDHIHTWVTGTPDGDWVSMAVPSDGSYGIPAGVIYGYPVTCKGGDYQIVQDLAINDFSRGKMDATYKELTEERDGVKDLL